MITNDELERIEQRFSRCLDAKPSKGPATQRTVEALIDSACDVPDLVREIRHLRIAIGAARSIHGPTLPGFFGLPSTCVGCGKDAAGNAQPWPCPTLVALDGAQ